MTRVVTVAAAHTNFAFWTNFFGSGPVVAWMHGKKAVPVDPIVVPFCGLYLES